MPDFSQRLVYRLPGVVAAVVQRDLAYREADASSPRMNVYQPSNLASGARLPAVLFIHGGPIPAAPVPQPTDWGVYIAYGELCAASGLIGVTFNHRFYDPAQLEQAGDDVRAAVDYVRAHAGELQIDSSRLAVWAFSGGGPFLSSFLRAQPDYLRCLAASYAVLDLRAYLGDAAANVSGARLDAFSPAANLNAAAADLPMFIARAGLDAPAINASIDLFVQKALAANAPLELMNHPQGHHGFDILDDDARTREITARAIEFMRMHLLAS
jgi:acetyl esterase/lipase